MQIFYSELIGGTNSKVFYSVELCFVLVNLSCEIKVDFFSYYITNFLAFVSIYFTVSHEVIMIEWSFVSKRVIRISNLCRHCSRKQKHNFSTITINTVKCEMI